MIEIAALFALLGAVVSDTSGRQATFTGWSCPYGPEELVQWLVERGEEVEYDTFAAHVDLSTAPLDEGQMEILPTDWCIVWLKTELPSGRAVWVMQHGGIEHLFAHGGVDVGGEGRLAQLLVEYFDELSEEDDVDLSDREEAQIVAVRERALQKNGER